MNSVLKRRSLLAVVFAAMAFAVVAMPALAFAETGDMENPQVIASPPWSQAASGTTIAITDDGETWYGYNYFVRLIKGKTYTFTSRVPSATATPDDFSMMMLLSPIYSPPGILFSDSGATGDVQTLKFMAPVTRYYWLALQSSQAASFTIDAAYSGKTWFRMSAASAPKSAKRNKSFTASVKLYPRYNSLGTPIKFQVQRKVGKKWKAYSTAKSSMTGLAPDYTQFASSVKIKKKGTYRVRAVFSDAANKARYTGYKTVKIK